MAHHPLQPYPPLIATTRRLRVAFWAVALVLGLAQAWANRDAMNPDGITYLDVGSAYARGDWSAAINGYFSPLYSWVVGAALAVTAPPPTWEFPVVHAVNFAIYIAALGCFEFLLRSLMRSYREPTGYQDWSPVPDWAWLVAGYTLFIWSSLHLITLTWVTPDMTVAALVYLAGGILLRIAGGQRGWVTFAALGATLGIGYLAKGAMFPLALVFLAASALTPGNLRAALPRVALAVLSFLCVCAPFAAALSAAKGRFTIGDTAKLNYAWYVNGVTRFVHWQGEPEGYGAPAHPPRVVSRRPVIYEFATPVGGSYPLWYDASYWYEGVRPRLDVVRQLKILVGYSGVYLSMFAPLLVGLFAHCFAAGRRCATRGTLAKYRCLLLPGAAALLMYGLIYVEPRFLGAFVVLFALGVFAAARLPARAAMAGAAPVALAAVLMAALGYGLLADAGTALSGLTGGSAPNPHAQVATELRALGVRAGDPVAVIGDGLHAYWARLARVRVVAELPSSSEGSFWAGDDTLRNRVFETLARTGARAVVAQELPSSASRRASGEGWRPVGTTGFAVYLLPRAPAPAARRAAMRPDARMRAVAAECGIGIPDSSGPLRYESSTARVRRSSSGGICSSL